MSDELFDELKEMVRKLEAKNAELIEKIDKLERENESLKAENSQLKNLSESNVAIQASQPMDGGKPKSKKCFKNWLLFETLPWINRKELANSSMSTASETFRQLCWPKLHGNVKPHKIAYLRISAAHMELGNFRALMHISNNVNSCGQGDEIIPIASIPPLDYILGIQRIEINFLNDEVVNFLKSIANLLQSCQLFKIMMSKKQHIESVRTLMDCLSQKIFLFRWWPNKLRLNDFNKIFPGIIDNIQFIRNWDHIPNNDIDEIDTILNWLTKQPNNGKQKFLQIGRYDEKFIGRINEEFSNSNSPSNFMINFYTSQNLDEFTQENVRTNEILALYRKNRDNGWGVTNYYFVARYPKGGEHWKEEGEKKIQEPEYSTSISINIP